jgi:hypothetical protein
MLKVKCRRSATKTSTKSIGSFRRKSGPKERSALREKWYAGGVARRNFGGICQLVCVKSEEIGLLGSREQPLLILEDAKFVARSKDEIEISVAEAKANWSAITAAALFYGASFRIMGNKIASSRFE